MKILFFTESLRPGGKERRIVELIRGLLKTGDYRIELALAKGEVEIRYKEILSLDVKIHLLSKRINYDFRPFFQFFKIVKEFNPDIIHAWGTMPVVYAVPSKIFLRIPILNSQITDVPFNNSRPTLAKYLSFPFSDKITANSKAGIKAYKAPFKKTSVIYNGFDFNRVKKLTQKSLIRGKFGITTKFIIGMVADFSENKDYNTYIMAANTILSQNNSVTFLCIGHGDDKKYRRMVLPEYKEKIKFLGLQEDVESIMNICDIGVLSTFTEGISNSLLEFSALKKPVISNYGGGNIELIDQGETGFLISQNSPEELVEKIQLLLNDKELRARLGENGFIRVRNKFSYDKMINQFSEKYKEMIKTSIDI